MQNYMVNESMEEISESKSVNDLEGPHNEWNFKSQEGSNLPEGTAIWGAFSMVTSRLDWH